MEPARKKACTRCAAHLQAGTQILQEKEKSFAKLVAGGAGDFEQELKKLVAESLGPILEDDTKGGQCLWRLATIFGSTRPRAHVPLTGARYEAKRNFVSAVLANQLVFPAMAKYQSQSRILGALQGGWKIDWRTQEIYYWDHICATVLWHLANRGQEAALASALLHGADPNYEADDVSVLLIALLPNEVVRTQTRLEIAKHLLDHRELRPDKAFDDIYRFLCEEELGPQKSEARKQEMLRGLAAMPSFGTIFVDEDQKDVRGGFLQRIIGEGVQYSLVLPWLPWLLQTFPTLRPPAYAAVCNWLVAPDDAKRAEKEDMLLALAELRGFSEAFQTQDARTRGFLQKICTGGLACDAVSPVLPLLVRTFPGLGHPQYNGICRFLAAPRIHATHKRGMLLALAELRGFSGAFQAQDTLGGGCFLQQVVSDGATYIHVLPVLPLLVQTFPGLGHPAYNSVCEFLIGTHATNKTGMLLALAKLHGFSEAFQTQDLRGGGGFLQKVLTNVATYIHVLPVLPLLVQTFPGLGHPTYGGVCNFLVAADTNEMDKKDVLLALARLSGFGQAFQTQDTLAGGFLNGVYDSPGSRAAVAPILPELFYLLPELTLPTDHRSQFDLVEDIYNALLTIPLDSVYTGPLDQALTRACKPVDS